jgi:hypothetical protein
MNTIQAAGKNAGYGGLPGSALTGKDVPVRDAIAFDGVRKSSLNRLLADQFRESLGPILPGDDLIHVASRSVKSPKAVPSRLRLGFTAPPGNRSREVFARPRVIRGTRAKSLPLLPSGPSGVHNRPLHEARSLTTTNVSIRPYFRVSKKAACNFSPKSVGATGFDSVWRSGGAGLASCRISCFGASPAPGG